MSHGLVTLSSMIMLLSGCFHLMTGVSAIADESFFVITPGYVLDMDVGTWGWLQAGLGVLVILAAFALLGGAKAARTVAIVLACVSALANFISIPYYPAWSVVMLVLDGIIILSITAYGRLQGESLEGV
jgi:hypothetical protein